MKKNRKIEFNANLKNTINEIIKLFAKVDKDFLEKLSPLLNRDLTNESIKDTEDYNMSVVSRFTDRGVRLLMEAGLAKTQALDLVKIINDHLRYLDQDESRMKELKEILEDLDFDYQKFPFLHQIESDIRAYFILRTNKNDTYSELMNELDLHMPKYMERDQWEFLKDCIIRGNKRLLKTDILFPCPVEGEEQGEKVELSEEQQKKYFLKYDENFFLEKRKDGPDMLALKELVNIVKGDDVHPLSIGPGFLLKYLPELRYRTISKEGIENIYSNDLYSKDLDCDMGLWHKSSSEEYIKSIPASYDQTKDWDGIVFKVNEKTKKLEKIELARIPSGADYILDGATLSSLLLFYSQTYKIDRKWSRIDEKMPELYIDRKNLKLERKDGKPIYQTVELSTPTGEKLTRERAIQYDNKLKFMDGYKYYVLVDSCVSGPKNQFPYLNEDISINDQIIEAGECYLYENDIKFNGRFLATRLYFYPYFPEFVNPMMQHGSVIFGSNDQSFHPCLRMPLKYHKPNHVETQQFRDFIGYKYLKDLFQGNFLPVKKIENDDFNNESNSIVARMVFLKTEGKKFDPSKHIADLLSPDKTKELRQTLRFQFDYSPRMLTISGIPLANPLTIHQYKIDKVFYEVVSPLLENFLPYNQRFAIWQYKSDFKGITVDKQPTYLERIANNAGNEEKMAMFIDVYKRESIRKIADSNGISYEEAEKIYNESLKK